MKEALIRAKYELGKEAIIVSQKPVRPGRWYQLFRKKMLEVTVAVEEKVHEKNRKEKEEFQKILFSKEPQMKSEDSSDMIQMAKETLKSTLERSIRNELQKAQEMFMMEEELHRKVFSESPQAKEKFEA
jgi:flagellar biosynthesis protein FlhF